MSTFTMDLHISHFKRIYEHALSNFKNKNIEILKTKKGNTQYCERNIISIMKTVLDELEYCYKEAGSQQPYDFRVNIPNTEETLLLELKKTDSKIVYFNDTCPSINAFYIILFTGKKYKTKDELYPCLFGINGNEFIKKDPWIYEYAKELNILKQKYKSIGGDRMSVYPRPTYKSNIQFLFDKYYEESKLIETKIQEEKLEVYNDIIEETERNIKSAKEELDMSGN